MPDPNAHNDHTFVVLFIVFMMFLGILAHQKLLVTIKRKFEPLAKSFNISLQTIFVTIYMDMILVHEIIRVFELQTGTNFQFMI